ncbi:MAG TPA: hypothetical protein QGG47_08760 [Acidobacteriota bacterium]|nr:hypothetical protein [Acidobacteriota bacterium]
MSSQSTDDEAHRARYFRQIERHFGVRRGGPLLLSPRDWQVVERWHDRGVPLDVVLRGINRAFDRFDAGGASAAKVNSLSYCKQQVEAIWEEHRRAATTSNAGVIGDEDPAFEHLGAAAAACRSAIDAAPELAEALEIAAAALDRLADEASGLGAAELDARANDIEGALRIANREHGTSRTLRLPRFSPWTV